jgi:transposase
MEECMVEKLVPKRQYTEEFKTEAVRLAQSVGQHEAARRLGVPVATLGNWTRRERNLEATSVDRTAASSPLKRPVSEMEAEITRLRKELASAKLDIEILRKATAYFAKGSR